MSAKSRNLLGVLIGAAILAAGGAAQAGTIADAASKLKDQHSDHFDQSSQSQNSDNSGNGSSARFGPSQDAPQQQQSHSDPAPSRPEPSHDSHRGNDGDRHGNDANRGHDRRDDNRGREGSSHSLNEDLGRLHGNSRDYDDRNRGNYRSGPRPPHVVDHLPSNRHDYVWRGNHYYFSGGHWYQPYGSTFISIDIPFGLFVTTLPGYYTSFWYGGTRYFYSDHTYFVYDPDEQGYLVTHSPYGDDDEEYNDSSQGDDLYVYPAKGQSEQQQADDRYECHRWAADQSHYDPLNDAYDANKNAAYRRAVIACLTGRGYTVN
ncbi:MAG TPA: DUF6515 family protein [Steroidobacteraceae bacterium]|nr:DUF6515 family protein [Steroidobacteraceae bacterium]